MKFPVKIHHIGHSFRSMERRRNEEKTIDNCIVSIIEILRRVTTIEVVLANFNSALKYLICHPQSIHRRQDVIAHPNVVEYTHASRQHHENMPI